MPCGVGIDVAQAQWDMVLRPSGGRGAVPNDASGVATLVARVQALKPPLLGLAATGGLARGGTSARATAGWPGVVGNPRQVRAVARALAHVTDVIRPTPSRRSGAPCWGAARHWSVMRTAAPHRLAGPHARLMKDSEAQMTWLHAGSATLDDALETRRRASPRGRENDDGFHRAQGLGPVCHRCAGACPCVYRFSGFGCRASRLCRSGHL